MMSFHTATLPEPVRSLAEEYIRYLLWKHTVPRNGETGNPQSPRPDMEAFLAQWTGIVTDSTDQQDARLDYLSKKYL